MTAREWIIKQVEETSQAQVAARLGVNQATVSRYASGKSEIPGGICKLIELLQQVESNKAESKPSM